MHLVFLKYIWDREEDFLRFNAFSLYGHIVWTTGILYVESLFLTFLSNNCNLVCPLGPKLEIKTITGIIIKLFPS